jgi:hypothetical protein
MKSFFFKKIKFGVFGDVRIKGGSAIPPPSSSLWEKLKNNDLFKPINIHDEDNKREIKIYFNKKVFIIGINIFLLSFIYSFSKDVYSVSMSRYNLSQVNNKNFINDLPKDLVISHNWKKFLLKNLELNKEKPDKIKELRAQISNTDIWIAALLAKYKEDYIASNMNILKSNTFSLGNNLLILWMISKYYWKSKKV